MRLDQADRLLVLLHYADGLSISEISAVLEQSNDEVTRRLDALRWRLARVARDASAQEHPEQVRSQGSDGVAAVG